MQPPIPQFTAPPRGVYCPTLTFFQGEGNSEVDYEAMERHVKRLVAARIRGIILHGTTGTPYLLRENEWTSVLRRTKSFIDAADADAAKASARASGVDDKSKGRHQKTLLIVGTGTDSLWETVERTRIAKEAGADYALVLPPALVGGMLSDEDVYGYYEKLCHLSPLPILLYNYPLLTNSFTLSTELITRLASLPKIVGIKLSCGDLNKIERLLDDPSLREPHFALLSGYGSHCTEILERGGGGSITGLANLVPGVCVAAFEEWMGRARGKKEDGEETKGKEKGTGMEHQVMNSEAQTRVNNAEGIDGGWPIGAVRYGLVKHFGYGGTDRSPLPELSEKRQRAVAEWLVPYVGNERQQGTRTGRDMAS